MCLFTLLLLQNSEPRKGARRSPLKMLIEKGIVAALRQAAIQFKDDSMAFF
jgi:hypothetical protein